MFQNATYFSNRDGWREWVMRFPPNIRDAVKITGSHTGMSDFGMGNAPPSSGRANRPTVLISPPSFGPLVPFLIIRRRAVVIAPRGLVLWNGRQRSWSSPRRHDGTRPFHFSQRRATNVAKLNHLSTISTRANPALVNSSTFSSTVNGTNTFSSASRLREISRSLYPLRRLKSK